MTTCITSPLELRLDEDTHRAFLGDRELVRLTSALALAGIINTQYFTDNPEPKVRGLAIHDAVLDDYEGGYPTVLSDYLPYWLGFKAFQAETRFDPISVEQPVWDEHAGYGGRYDLFGRFPDLPAGYDLVDVKTGKAPDYVGLQTVGYSRRILLKGVPVPRCRRWALELSGDYRYRLIPLNMQKDSTRIDRSLDMAHERVLLAAVAIANWKKGWLV